MLSNEQSRDTRALLTLLCITFMQLLVTACTPPSPEAFYRATKQFKLEKHQIKGHTFPMIYYTRGLQPGIDNLHVYLGGDGLPWLDIMTFAEDPTPRNPLVLELMNQDDSPALFLGRPCYQGFYDTPPCDYYYWTAGRYSPEVVNNMRDAILQLVKKYNVKNLTLIGFSGGGALATLLANDLHQTTTVVTIAGLLDTTAWTELHNYSPLNGSLNPVEQAPLKKHIRQIHLTGNRDENIPASIIRDFLDKQYKVENP